MNNFLTFRAENFTTRRALFFISQREAGRPPALHVHRYPILRARATLGYREKKCPQVRYVTHVYYAVYILYNDYYYQIITEVAQLR